MNEKNDLTLPERFTFPLQSVSGARRPIRLSPFISLVASLLLAACGSGGSGGEADVAGDLQPAVFAISATSSPAAFATSSPAGFATAVNLPPVIPGAVVSSYQFDADLGSTSYDVTILQVPGGDLMGVSLNDSGVVAGNYLTGPGRSKGFLWNGGRVSVVIPEGQVTKINENGAVSGWLDAAGGTMACLYEDGLFSMQAGKSYGVNDYGVVVGMQKEAYGTRAFIDDGSVNEVLLPDFNGYGVLINNSDTVVLHEVRGDTVVPYLLEGDQLRALPTLGGNFTFARDMNAAGDVVGWAESSGGNRAVLWQDGLLSDITPANESSCAAVGINDSAEIVIKCSGVAGNSNYHYWANVVTAIDNLGASSATVNDINNQGQITGWLYSEEFGHDQVAFLATPVN